MSGLFLLNLGPRIKLGRVGTGRRQYRIFNLGLIARQGLQERGDVIDFLLGVAFAELKIAHDGDGFFKRPDGTVMEVRIGKFDVAQHRDLEGHAILIASGNGLDAFGGVRGLIGTHDPHLLEGLTAQLSAVVADRAARFLEELVAVQFLLGDCVFVALEPLVESSVRGNKRAFKFGHGFGDALDVDLSVAEGLFEVGSVAGN